MCKSVSNMSKESGYRPNAIHMNEIPHEILPRIFSYLLAIDRKQVRLTCILWYNSCNRLSILKDEKFVFRSGYSIQEISKYLLTHQFIHLNLEFQGLPIDTFPVSTWKACGSKINSIKFHECKVTDRTLKNIILHCLNLREFYFEKTSDYHFNISQAFCSPKMFDELIQANVQRKKLQTFQISVDRVNIPSIMYRNIFQVFPCIRSFSAGASLFDDMFFISSYVHGYYPRCCFTRIDKYLITTVVEELVFNIPSDCSWSKSLIDDPDLKLKKLETIYTYSRRNYSNFLQFIEKQKELRIIRISIAEICDEKMKELLFHILKSCRKLNELRYNFRPMPLHLTANETKIFFELISNLQYLKMSYDFFPDVSVLQTLPPAKNQLLHTLKLKSIRIEECYCIGILKHFSGLRHLELSVLSDNILQEIFKSHTLLENLLLWETDRCTDFGFTGFKSIGEDSKDRIGYSITRLKHLKHLEIDGLFSGDALTENSLKELTFPILEYLRLSLGKNANDISEETLRSLAFNLPSLKVMMFDNMYFTFDELWKFCKIAKQLYRLICTRIDNENDDMVSSFFDACPTLRFFSNSYTSTYCYNPFTKKILHKNSRDFQFSKKSFEDTQVCFCIHLQ